MSQNELKKVREASQRGNLVVFLGAGVSYLAPTCLPSWWEINRAVIRALVGEAGEITGSETPQEIGEAIWQRQDSGKLPPEYQAQIIAERLSGLKYFKVLQCLDGDLPNSVHLSIASLAREGRIKAVITTNFDRLLEKAFAQVGLGTHICSKEGDFASLYQSLEEGKAPQATPLLKIHGSVEDPATLIDTLAQKKQGLPLSTTRCLRHYLHKNHWLFLGYSGADLEADSNYLNLRGDFEKARGFTWLIRSGDLPVPALARLSELYGYKGQIIQGELPEWLNFLTGDIEVPSPEKINAEKARKEARQKVKKHTSQWASEFGSISCGVILAFLGEAASLGSPVHEFLKELERAVTEEEKGSEDHGLLLYALASSYHDRGKLQRALPLLEASIAILQTWGKDLKAAKLVSQKGDILREQGHLDRALRLYEKARPVIEREGRRKDRTQFIEDLAGIHFDRAEYDMAETLYRRCMEIYREGGDEMGVAICHNLMGGVDFFRERYSQAMDHFDRALATYERLGSEGRRAGILNNKGNIFYCQGDYDRALEYWIEAKSLYQLLGQEQSALELSNNLAMIHMKKGHFQAARELLQDILLQFEKEGNLAGQAKTYGNLANLLRKEEEYDRAERYYNQCLDLFEKMNNQGAAAPWYRERGTLYRQQKKWKQAALDQRKAMEIHESTGDWMAAGNNAYDLGILSDLQRDREGARDWMERAARNYRKGGAGREVREAERMVRKYSQKGCLSTVFAFFSLGGWALFG